MLKALKPPPFEKLRKPIKASIALLIAAIMTLSDRCREAIGPGSLLVCIVTVLYFPSRTVGIVLEDVVYGTFGALVGVGYSALGMYTADLARATGNPIALQPASSGILVAYLFVGTFALNYIRLKFPRANYATICAAILVMFTLTQSAVIPGFQPVLLWGFMKPIAAGGAIVLAVSALIWPDDSMTNFMTVLIRSLDANNTFFKEHSDAFLSLSSSSLKSTLPSLHDRLQGSNLLLIDCKRAVHRDILYSRLNGQDVSKLTQIVKEMRNPLHGIGLSQIRKNIFLEGSPDTTDNVLLEAIEDLQSICGQLADACATTLSNSISRLQSFKGNTDRTTLNSVLWPFPRIFYSGQKRSKHVHTRIYTSAEELQQLIEKLDRDATESSMRLWAAYSQNLQKQSVAGLHLMSIYRYNMQEYSKVLISLVVLLEEFERDRTRRRLWLPTTKSFSKWFKGSEFDPQLGGEATEGLETNELTKTQTKTDAIEDIANPWTDLQRNGKHYHRDPDVNPPENAAQKFFLALYRVQKWLMEPDTFLSIKAAAGTVLLSVPIFLPHTVDWYIKWHGQWAIIILMLWMFPMSGMFLYSGLMRVLGTVCGGVVAIIAWEISQGNPYGLGAILFIVNLIFYYILLYVQPLKILAIMSLITIYLVDIYEYGFLVQGIINDNPVWTFSGIRMLVVIIGVGAAVILSMIPAPVTGRVELRKRLAVTIGDIGRLYGIISSQFVGVERQKINEKPAKQFRHLAVGLQRQIADARIFLKLSAFEPPLRGKFPADTYQVVIEKVANMADLIYGMAYSSRRIQPEWAHRIAKIHNKERLAYTSSMMLTIKLTGATLASKMALPPYMMSPIEARDQFIEFLSRSLTLTPDDLTDPSFLPFMSFYVERHAFVDELQELLEAVQDLVGIEDPQEWIRLYS